MEEKKNSSVGSIIAGVIACLVFAASITAIIIAVNSGDKWGGSGDEPGSVSTSTGEPIGEHVRGKEDSDVVVIEYADMQCPGCAAMMPVMDSMYEKYGSKVKFIYRHYPINSHKNSKAAATAVEAAGRQGYFWEMLSSVFANQIDWYYESGSELTDAFVVLFKEVSSGKGDVSRFRTDLGDLAIATKIDEDKQLGIKSDITATPSIFVNGKMVETLSASTVSSMIEEALKK